MLAHCLAKHACGNIAGSTKGLPVMFFQGSTPLIFIKREETEVG